MAFAAAALPYMQAAGAGLSAIGAYQGSQANKTALRMNAQVAENNATIAGWQAQDAIRRGEKDASRMRMKGNQTKGTQRARLAANGVDLGTGSALNILTDTDHFTAVDATTITDNAAREAWAIRAQAQNFSTDAALMRGRADMESPFMAAGTSLLTSAGKVAGNWYGSKADKPRRGHDTFAEGEY